MILRFLFIAFTLLSVTAFGVEQLGTITVITDIGHGTTTAQSFIIEGLTQTVASNPSNDCLFLEIDHRANPYFEKYLRDSSYKILLSEWMALWAKTTGTWLADLLPEKLLQIATKNQMKIFGVDLDYTSAEGKRLHEGWRRGDKSEAFLKLQVDRRNQIMSDEIARHFYKQSCKNGIFIVGSSHIKRINDGLPSKPAQDFLGELGFSVQMIEYPEKAAYGEQEKPMPDFRKKGI